MTYRLLFWLALSIAISACSWVPFIGEEEVEEQEAAPTLADLQPAVMPDKNRTLPMVDLNTLITTYQEVLDVTDEPELRLRVLHRLAGLEMKRAEQNLYEQEVVANQFELAIDAYQTLLASNPEHPRNDRLRYQLSKAYDLGGQQQQSMEVLDQLVVDSPASDHYSEAQFRRAEIFFSRADYRNAELAYAEVIRQGKEKSQHYENALYMHGWSQFKRERYRASLQSFTEVLDLNVPADNKLDNLSRGMRELTQDTFRIMSIVFSYLDGPKTISEVYDNFGERHYIGLLYDNLAKLYLEQERYKDSAEAYRTYVERYPQSDQSPVFYASLIDAYLTGGFSEDVLREKEQYIVYYGIHSEFWQSKSEESQNYIRPFLEQYLPELARHYHAKAQEKTVVLNPGAEQEIKSDETSLTDNALTDKTLTEKERTELKQLAISEYLKAGDYYQEFIDTFPEDEQVPEMHFLLAESRFEAEVYDQAIEAYEIVAYKYPDHERGAIAGYAAILSYGLYLERLPDGSNHPDYENWLRLKIESQLRFANTFADDANAPIVLTKSAEELLGLEEYQHAVDAASQLTRRDPPAEQSLRKTAWLVIGHSQFELQDFVAAENAYHEVLQILPSSDVTRNDIVERLAASVYKQAELALAAEQPLEAADQFLRVAVVAPNSSISITAKFDAANALMNSAHYAEAIPILDQFRRNYPDNPLTADIPAKMVVAYQETEQWSMAADELTAIYQGTDDEALKQETLYQAAELYERADDKESAILRYRAYAHAYPDPFPIAMEARNKLNELYVATNQPDKRRFWLRKMITAHDTAGQQATDRSRYLAAMSSSVLADDEYQAFQRLRLTLPLKNSLQRKRKALDKTLNAYQKLADYQVEEYTTLATFRIGEIYNKLSGALMESDRPKDLDALALEQYELLLEEQAFPFEEKAIEIHEANSQRSWDGVYDAWVKESFDALKQLLPARYAKEEKGGLYASEIY